MLPLLNRRAFKRELTRAIGLAARYGTPASLIYFDLDEFKRVNDAFGHPAGDAVLAHFAETLLAHVRDSDVVARLGGDEFGVILAHNDQEQAEAKAAALASNLFASPALWNGRQIDICFSWGVFELGPATRRIPLSPAPTRRCTPGKDAVRLIRRIGTRQCGAGTSRSKLEILPLGKLDRPVHAIMSGSNASSMRVI